MALVDCNGALQNAIRRLIKMTPPEGIELLSYKRNRGVTVLLKKNGAVSVRERGYREEEITLPFESLEKHLKSIIKREFPRSRKVRMYVLSGPEDVGMERKKL